MRDCRSLQAARIRIPMQVLWQPTPQHTPTTNAPLPSEGTGNHIRGRSPLAMPSCKSTTRPTRAATVSCGTSFPASADERTRVRVTAAGSTRSRTSISTGCFPVHSLQQKVPPAATSSRARACRAVPRPHIWHSGTTPLGGSTDGYLASISAVNRPWNRARSSIGAGPIHCDTTKTHKKIHMSSWYIFTKCQAQTQPRHAPLYLHSYCAVGHI